MILSPRDQVDHHASPDRPATCAMGRGDDGHFLGEQDGREVREREEREERERSEKSEKNEKKKIAAVFTGGDAGESAGDVEEVGPWVPADEVVGRLEQLRSQQQQHGERL